MTRRTTAAFVFSVILTACSSTQQVANTAPTVDKVDSDEKGAAAAESEKTESESAEPVETGGVRPAVPGDYVIHRYSGTYRDVPLTLQERVISREGELTTFEYRLEEGDLVSTYRVQKVDGDFFSVSRVEDDGVVEVPVEDLEKVLASTNLSADRNEEKLAEEKVTVLVSGEEVQATKVTYRVVVGDKEAVLVVLQSADFPRRDLGGEIVAEDGSVLYRAELLEVGSDGADSSVARKE